MSNKRDLKDIEKERILMKMKQVGGLSRYINSGLSNALFDIFKNELEPIYQLLDDIFHEPHSGRNERLCNEKDKLVKKLEPIILNYLNTRIEQRKYTEDELNAVEYVIDWKEILGVTYV